MGSSADDARRVFDTLADCWLQQIQRLAPFLSTGCSWEEWVNVEGWIALHAASYEVTPRAKYLALPPGARNRPLGDLLVKLPDIELMVEVRVIHDWTYAKYAATVDEDPEKLRLEAEAGRAALFVLILIALDKNKPWAYLDRLRCWGVPTDLRRDGVIGETGSSEIAAGCPLLRSSWRAQPSGANAEDS